MASPGADAQNYRVDLSEDSGFFLELLFSKQLWRERLVGELRFGEGDHVHFKSSYQIGFPPELLRASKVPSGARYANILLPLTTREKRPLLNFGLAGPGGCPATLTSRASIANLQAQYLQLLAEDSSAFDQLRRIDPQLYESISVFSPGVFERWFWDRGDSEASLARYLSNGLGWPVSLSDVRRWRDKTTEVASILVAHLHEPPDPLSSSEEVLLALPVHNPLPGSREEVDRLIANFHGGVAAADRVGAVDYLEVLAEYGRRYEVVVEVEVPLLEPSRIKIEEDLPVKVEHRDGDVWVEAESKFPLGDARSAHLEVRVDDPHVEITAFEIRDSKGQDAEGSLEAVRETSEACAFYSSNPDRPFYVAVLLSLSVARPLIAQAAILSMANVVAAAAIIFVSADGSPGGSLAALTIPTTVAAAFALVREQTALADRLQRGPRIALAFTALALWLVAIASIALTNDSADGSRSRPAGKAESTGKQAFAE